MDLTFEQFRELVREQFKGMCQGAAALYIKDVDEDVLWEKYLENFEPKDNELFRERRRHDCSTCRQFIKRAGAVIAIKDGEVSTLWDIDVSGSAFEPSVLSLRECVRSAPVKDVFVSRFKKIGAAENIEQQENGDMFVFKHMYLYFPERFVLPKSETLDGYIGNKRDIRNVFKRSLDEISIYSIDTVLELIRSNTLYKGKEWEQQLVVFREMKLKYDGLTDEQKELFAWEKSAEAGPVIGRIRNHSIGVLLTDITNNVELNTAVTKYEKIVAPSNYKRPKAIYTQKMLDEAKETITELGYLDSLGRRFAKLDDITVNNILFANRDSAKRISGADDIFAELAKTAVTKPQKFDRVEEVTPEKFVKEILPTATEVEVFLENRHGKNMMSLIAPVNKDSKTMFKWDNNFSWAYTGNMTDSMKERVKSKGGRVDGDLRFSIQWNDGDFQNDDSDLDAHCKTPGGFHIFYNQKRDPYTKGELDVDIMHPSGEIAVENITWQSRSTMDKGEYLFFVHQYCNRGHRNGFRAEIEFDGNVYYFDYPNEMRTNEDVEVAVVTLTKANTFKIRELLPSTTRSKLIWNVKTMDFVPVSVICYSPNYWDEQSGIGNQHLFFVLKDCVNPESPNGFYNEFLKNELSDHRRVFEALGSKMRVQDTPDQLSGVGFSLTQRNEIVVRVKGNTERVIKIKF